MSKLVTGSEALAKRLAAIPEGILKELRPVLVKSANEIATDARALVPKRSGALAGSIDVTGPGETTPAFASDGGRRVVNENEAVVTAGEPKVRHGHLVEFGTGERAHSDGTSTGKMPEHPFLIPALRLNRARIDRRIKRAIAAAIKKGATDV